MRHCRKKAPCITINFPKFHYLLLTKDFFLYIVYCIDYMVPVVQG